MDPDLDFRARLQDKRGYPILAVAMVVLVAVVGINLLPRGRVEGDRPAAPTSAAAVLSASATPRPSPTRTVAVVDPDSGDLSSGRSLRTVDGVAFSFGVPAPGWEPYGSLLISKSDTGPQGAEGLIFWTGYPGGLYAEPCSPLDDPDNLARASDLPAAVSRAPGTELVSGPSEVTVGGRPATHVVVTVREKAGCDPGFFYNWKSREGGAFWQTSEVGDTIRVWIVEVDGLRLFIGGETRQDAGPELKQEIQQIIDSIRFG